MTNTFFQGGEKIFSFGFASLITVLLETNKFSFSEMLRKEHAKELYHVWISTMTSSNESS